MLVLMEVEETERTSLPLEYESTRIRMVNEKERPFEIISIAADLECGESDGRDRESGRQKGRKG